MNNLTLEIINIFMDSLPSLLTIEPVEGLFALIYVSLLVLILKRLLYKY